jgi:glycosyltransferase involved in cell wall biosynthesis
MRLKVLISAYACEPNSGSEPGVGWNMVRVTARRHDVWAITRANNREIIEAELSHNPIPGLRFEYYDLPLWARWWKRGQWGIRLYYYVWQIGAYFAAKRLHKKIGFDLTHHVTFVKYWAPSSLALLPRPFIWGPVGGGDSAPKAFWRDFGLRGNAYELAREFARWLSEHDPFVRVSARRSVRAFATTQETADRMRGLGATDVQLLSQLALSEEDLERLGDRATGDESVVRFISIGRLSHLKGFHLGLRAFARAQIPNAVYWIVGDGPERKRLQALAEQLSVASRVEFLGTVPRKEALYRLGACVALVHPSLHDSGGLVCLEAMGAGRPVICLDIGGPAVQITDRTGFKIPATTPERAVSDLAKAMVTVARDPDLGVRMGELARERAIEHFSWDRKGVQLDEIYRQTLDGQG